MRNRWLRHALVVSVVLAVVGPVGVASAHAAVTSADPHATGSSGSPAQDPKLAARTRSIPQKTIVRHNTYAVRAAVPQLARPTVGATAESTFETADVGTPVCGQIGAVDTTTTWTAAGAPYLICASGVTVDGSLILDGSDGGFEIQAQGINGLTVATQSSSLTTANTTADSRITFDSAGDITWAGLSGAGN